jgi:spore maturation protein CgeB
VRRYRPQVVWVDGGYCLSREALRRIKGETPVVLVHYTPDSLQAPGWYPFLQALSEYDLVITTKPRDREIYRAKGAKRVLLSRLGYDPRLHRPLKPGPQEAARFNCDVAFVGVRMEDRARSLCRLAREVNCRLHLYGRGWDQGSTGKCLAPFARGWVHGDDYAKALSSAKICLAFLNRTVGDTYTTRSLEIPACGAFMLAERTPAHLELFEEDREAAYFASDEELVDKVKFYLAHDRKRQEIALAGHAKLKRLGYTWEDHLKTCLIEVKRLLEERWGPDRKEP